jgi:hypothetical protein
VSPRGKNDSADSGTNSARGQSPGGYPQSRPSSKATRNCAPLNCPSNSNVPAYFASSAAGSVTALPISALSAGQLHRSAAPPFRSLWLDPQRQRHWTIRRGGRDLAAEAQR